MEEGAGQDVAKDLMAVDVGVNLDVEEFAGDVEIVDGDVEEFEEPVSEENTNSGVSQRYASKRKRKRGDPSAGWCAGVVMLVSCMVGASSMSLPFAFKSAGVLPGIIMLVLAMGVGNWTMRALVKCISYTGKRKKRWFYVDIGRAAFGMKGELCVRFSFLLNLFGVASVLCIVLADQSEVVNRFFGNSDSFFLNRNFLLFVLLLFIAYPLTLLKNISSLRFSSFFSMFCFFLLNATIFVRSLTNIFRGDGCRFKVVNFSTDIFLAIPICSVAFISHVVVFEVKNEQKKRTEGRVYSIVHATTSFAIIFYFFLGIFGYLRFCENTKGDVLLGFEEDDDWVNVIRVLIGIAASTLIPVMFYPLRITFDTLMFPGRRYTRLRHFLEVSGLLVCCYVLAVLVPDIAKVFDLIGSITASLIMYLMPSIFFLKLRYKTVENVAKAFVPTDLMVLMRRKQFITAPSNDDSSIAFVMHDEDQRANSCPSLLAAATDYISNVIDTCAAVSIALTGVFVLITCTTVVIYKWVTGYGD